MYKFIIGKSKAILISKIEKIIAIKNGILEDYIGPKPHSNGDFFCKS